MGQTALRWSFWGDLSGGAIRLSVLRDLFGSVLIPPAMYREVVEQGHGFPVKEAVETALGDWLSVQTVQNRELVTEICAVGRLDEGESEAIVLAQECHADRILADDQRGVRCARGFGITVTRTPVIYGEAKLRGWIPGLLDTWSQGETGCPTEEGFQAKGSGLPNGAGQVRRTVRSPYDYETLNSTALKPCHAKAQSRKTKEQS